MSTTKVKLFKNDNDGLYHVICHRSSKDRLARNCYTCSKFIDIDPVKAEIKCRED